MRDDVDDEPGMGGEPCVQMRSRSGRQKLARSGQPDGDVARSCRTPRISPSAERISATRLPSSEKRSCGARPTMTRAFCRARKVSWLMPTARGSAYGSRQFSIRATEGPRSASRRALISPVGLAPTTTTSATASVAG
nr:hypothetical protein [Streptomyces mangrovisoli]